ncbi:Heat shock protein 42 [Yarrowia sp. B02]|nr:Heat shock protein 42 [Yarrowia sp. B02]
MHRLDNFFAERPYLPHLRSHDNSLTQDAKPTGAPFAPPMDLYDNDKQYLIHLSLPGVFPEDLEVETDADLRLVTVKGVFRNPYEDMKENLRINERRNGAFERQIKFPKGTVVEEENISAKLTNGVLEISLKKVEGKEREVRRIKVECC